MSGVENGWHAKIFKRVCERCGTLIRIENIKHYAYKRSKYKKPSKKTDYTVRYFCGWNCMCKWDEDHTSNWRKKIEE